VIQRWLRDLDAVVPRALPNALIRGVVGVIAILIGCFVASVAVPLAIFGLFMMWGSLLLFGGAVLVIAIALLGFGVAAVRIRPMTSTGE
jgi:hypothetical protein